MTAVSHRHLSPLAMDSTGPRSHGRVASASPWW